MNTASKSRLKAGINPESREFVLDGRRVMLIDIPGFDDTYQSDTDVLKSIAVFLGES